MDLAVTDFGAGGEESEAAERFTGTGGVAPVMMLHGFTGSGPAMEPLAARLAARLPAWVVCPDLVGHGRSEAPEDPARYTVEAMAEQVLGLAEALEFGAFHLVGYSMGGRVALTLGCLAASRLRSLTVIGASGGIDDADRRSKRRQADTKQAQRILEDFEGFVDEWMAQPLFASQAVLGENHRRTAREQRLAADPEGLARSLTAAGAGAMTPLTDRLGQVDVPVLLMAGAEDVKFCAIAEQLAARLPRSRVDCIDSAGHAAHLEQPATTAAKIADFITAAEATGAEAGMCVQESAVSP